MYTSKSKIRQISDCQGGCRKITPGQGKLLGVMDIFIMVIVTMSKCIKLYNSNMRSLLYVRYT